METLRDGLLFREWFLNDVCSLLGIMTSRSLGGQQRAGGPCAKSLGSQTHRAPTYDTLDFLPLQLSEQPFLLRKYLV